MQFRRPKIGLLALSLQLYRTLAPDVRQNRTAWLRRDVLPILGRLADVLFDDLADCREDVEATIRRFEAAGADVLVVVFATYAPSQIALGPLQATRLPVVVWNTQELLSVDTRFSVAAMLDNHGVHGTQDLANVLLRSDVPFHYVTSHPSDSQGLEELADFFMAAAAVGDLSRCRLGILGYPFPGMGDFAVDSTHLAATLGCTWESLPIEDYHMLSAGAPPAEVQQLMADYTSSYCLADDLTQADLEVTARAELALRSMVAGHRLHALTFQFLALGEDERTATLPFVAISRMMADGVGFAGEGDLVGAAGAWFLNRLHSPASFSEVFTIDFAGNSALLSHMGEANVAMARQDRKVSLVAREPAITRSRGRQLVLATTFQPGPATLCALAMGPGRRWRLIVSRIEIEDFGPLTALPVPHSKMAVDGDIRQWLTAYATAGGPHHHAICLGDARGRLQFAARLLGAEYHEV